MKEQDIQRACLEILMYKGIFCWKVNNVGIYKKATGCYIPTGMKGVPDIIAVIKGKFIGIECKMPGKKQTESQVEFQNKLEEAGGIYWLIDDPSKLLDKLKPQQ